VFGASTRSTSPKSSGKRLILVAPRGFCAGVERAVDIVWLALRRYQPPVYVRKELVHNKHVLRELESAGAVFVDELADVPAGSVVIFSAHGVSPAVRAEAEKLQSKVIDATCPLVMKVHHEASRLSREGYSILLIGYRNHEEVVGTSGEANGKVQVVGTVAEAAAVQVIDPSRVCYLTQTTLSLDDTRLIIERLKARFPAIKGPPSQDICYATQNRQLAVKAATSRCDHLLVVGSANSSNSQRLVDVARARGVAATLIEDSDGIPWGELEGARTLGVTAGASTPETVVAQVVELLRIRGYFQVERFELVREDVKFTIPVGLRT